MSSGNAGEAVLAAGNGPGIKLGKLGQLAAEGDKTNVTYDVSELRRKAQRGTLLDLVSTRSKKRCYGVTIRPGATDQKCHAEWKCLDGRAASRSDWRKVTLLRDKGGLIKIVPGWV